MKLGLSHTLAMVGLGLATFAITPAHAQTTAPGPYYATPSWDQKLPAATRFIVLSNWNNEAVLDRETGLVWERSPDTTFRTWTQASSHCNNRSVGGRKGWGLPGIRELASLVDPTVALPGPTLPAGHPFSNVQFGPTTDFQYWSGTLDHFDPRILVWTLNFGRIDVRFGAQVTEGGYAWCVRGGRGPDAQ